MFSCRFVGTNLSLYRHGFGHLYVTLVTTTHLCEVANKLARILLNGRPPMLKRAYIAVSMDWVCKCIVLLCMIVFVNFIPIFEFFLFDSTYRIHTIDQPSIHQQSIFNLCECRTSWLKCLFLF